ncbi:MAG: hypothetical protein M5U07_20095 [Xanthobacteraceae bacterium]|nr:hypothetical protein [Xanthobacteraceae bacterium]
MDAPAPDRRAGPAGATGSRAARTRGDRGATADLGGRLLLPLVRKLERNWPVSVALILLAFMALSFLRSA